MTRPDHRGMVLPVTSDVSVTDTDSAARPGQGGPGDGVPRTQQAAAAEADGIHPGKPCAA